MITMDDIAAWFGGQIPTWFWIVAAIVLVVGAVVFSVLTPKKKPAASSSSIRVSRDSDGSFYAYDTATGEVLYRAAAESEVRAWKKEMTGK